MSSRINHGLMSSGSDRWFTPPDLLAEIAAFLGGSYYDPCPASWDELPAEDGLAVPWTGRGPVFINPPYGSTVRVWVAKALEEPIDELVLLVAARTDTGWFQPLFDHPICFLRGRLHFSGSAGGAPFPSALVYKGRRQPQEFARAFAHRGRIVVPVRTDDSSRGQEARYG